MKTNDKTGGLSTPFRVFMAILKENESLRPYLKAWSGDSPYEMWVAAEKCLLAALFSTAVAIIVQTWFTVHWRNPGGYVLLFVSTPIWIACMLRNLWLLRRFCVGVTWIEVNSYYSTMVNTSDRNLDTLLCIFVPNAYHILQIERKIEENSMFPRRTCRLKKDKEVDRQLLVEKISLIRPFFVELRADNVFGRLFYLAGKRS